jgi:hypothetical protein
METNMKKTTIAVALLALILSAAPSLAQTFLTTTTLGSAVSSATADTVVVASASTVAAGGVLYVDRELMGVVSVSGTTVRVTRGQQGTKAGPHGSGAIVIVGPAASLQGSGPFGLSSFGQADPPAGACTTSPYRYLPIVNVVTGDVWSCRWVGSGTQTTKVWAATNIVSVNGQTSLIVQ